MKFILLLDGMTGAGKTTLTRSLAKVYPRTAIVGMDKVKHFISDFERGTRDNAIARDIVSVMAKKYLELGLSLVIDQSFTEAEIAEYEKLAKDYSIPCFKIQLYASTEVARARILERRKESTNPIPLERIERNLSLFEERSHLGFTTIDTSNLSPDEVFSRVQIIISDQVE